MERTYGRKGLDCMEERCAQCHSILLSDSLSVGLTVGRHQLFSRVINRYTHTGMSIQLCRSMSACLCISLFVFSSIYPPICVPAYKSASEFICLTLTLTRPSSLSEHHSILTSLPIGQSICLCVYLMHYMFLHFKWLHYLAYLSIQPNPV